MSPVLKNILFLGIGLGIGVLGSSVYYSGPINEKDNKIQSLEVEVNNAEQSYKTLENKLSAVNLYYKVTGKYLGLNSANNYEISSIPLNELTEEEIINLTMSCGSDNYFNINEEDNILEYHYFHKTIDEVKKDLDNLVTVYKPVIYVYSAYDGQQVKVSLDTDNKITCEYPKRDENGVWDVRAFENGSLILNNNNALIYNYLYWEGDGEVDFDFSSGYCVKGSDSAEFLEKILSEIGLNRREANEFIVYWLPRLEANKYNLISFQTENYTNEYQLKIEPKTSNILRVFMAFKGLEEPVEIEAQDIYELNKGFERQGLHIVEWGGSEVTDSFN